MRFHCFGSVLRHSGFEMKQRLLGLSAEFQLQLQSQTCQSWLIGDPWERQMDVSVTAPKACASTTGDSKRSLSSYSVRNAVEEHES